MMKGRINYDTDPQKLIMEAIGLWKVLQLSIHVVVKQSLIPGAAAE
ncbi:hypothetical protein [Segetibacter koreensis]|nr:hypothetical protein [Segetibacter koreensis]